MDAHAPGHRDHIADADFLGQRDGDGVDAVGQRVGQGHGAKILAAEIGRGVTGNIDRLIVARFPGRDARFQCRQIDEGLEGRAGLAIGLGGAVENGFAVIDAAQQRADRAIGLHHHHRRFAGAGALFVFGDGVDGGEARGFLNGRFHGGVDHQVGRGRLAVDGRQLQRLVGGGVQVIVAGVAGGAIDDHGRMGARLCRLFLCDGAIVHHGIQHQAGALLGAQEIAARREDRRRARQRRQHRGLGEIEILRALAEIDAARSVDAIGAAAQINAVEVKLEYLVLGQRFFQARRAYQFAELARKSALLLGVDDLGGLLADGRSAGHQIARLQVQDDRPRQAARIDAVMGIEAPVFHGDEGGWQEGWHLLQFQPRADDGAAMTHFVALGVQEGEGQGAIDGVKVDLGIQRRREEAQHHRPQIEQRQGNGEYRHGNGEGRGVAVRYLSRRIGIQAVLPVGHWRDS